MRTMRRASVLILLVLIIGSLPPVSGLGVKEPVQRDVFIYQYFSQVLERFDESVRYALLGENSSVELAESTLAELELMREEVLYYQERGVSSKVSLVLPPFYDFARNLVVLVNLTLEFNEMQSPAIASGILSTVNNLEKDLDEIADLELVNGSERLRFSTDKLRKDLEDVKRLALSAPAKGGFLIGVSDASPMINQTVTIFGSCPENSPLKIFIQGNSSTAVLVVTPKDGLFSVTYRFERLGSYRIYALQGGNRSNTVTVSVRKIPTFFVVGGPYSALINHNLTLRGRLVDYYGRALPGRAIEVNNETLVTGQNGSFSVSYFSRKPIVFNVTLKFAGDGFHAGTVKSVKVEFKRYPVSITLNGPSKVSLGEKAGFNGSVRPALNVPLTVYVNGRAYMRIHSKNGAFSFSFKPNETGNFRVYVVFPGNETYAKAVSNTVILSVVKAGGIVRYVLLAALALAIAGVGFVRRREKKGEKVPEVPAVREPERSPEVPPEIPEDVGKAYSLLRELLVKRFGLPRNMTPREILKALGDWELYPELEKVTLLHEKAVYGREELGEVELKEFREAMRTLLGGVSE